MGRCFLSAHSERRGFLAHVCGAFWLLQAQPTLFPPPTQILFLAFFSISVTQPTDRPRTQVTLVFGIFPGGFRPDYASRSYSGTTSLGPCSGIFSWAAAAKEYWLSLPNLPSTVAQSAKEATSLVWTGCSPGYQHFFWTLILPSLLEVNMILSYWTFWWSWGWERQGPVAVLPKSIL